VIGFDPVRVLKKLQEARGDDAKIAKILDSLTDAQGRLLLKIVQENKEIFGIQEERKIPEDPASFAEKYSLKLNPNQPWVRAKHLDLVSSYLADLATGKRKRVMISMSPRRGKSQLTSFWSIIWRLAKNPSTRIGIASYSQELAVQWSSRIRDFIRDYGSEIGVELDPTSTAKHNWRTTAGGGVQAAGRGGPFTGFGFDYIVLDDVLKNAEEAMSEEVKKDCWEWFVSVVQSRMEPQTTFCLIGTRWAFDDLLGRLEQLSNSGEGLKWDIIKLPEIAEKNDPLGRAEGEVLWPERFPIELVMDQKKATPSYFWSALYQQSPLPSEGGLFKFQWWQHYKVLPDIRKFDIVIQSWDFSFKDLKKSDYVVGQVWGRIGASFYLIDQVRKQMNAKDSIAAIRAFTNKYPTARAKLFEDKANGPALKSLLNNEVGGIIPINPKGTKEVRAMAIQPFVEAGNVFLPDPSIAPWVGDVELECAQFPLGAHDDIVDAMTQAINYLAPAGMSRLNRAHYEAQEENRTFGQINPTKMVEEGFWASLRKQTRKAERELRTKLKGGEPSRTWND
jgi:predicted phage terminase large subunit-like protein